jgi:hypothetical protein
MYKIFFIWQVTLNGSFIFATFSLFNVVLVHWSCACAYCILIMHVTVKGLLEHLTVVLYYTCRFWFMNLWSSAVLWVSFIYWLTTKHIAFNNNQSQILQQKSISWLELTATLIHKTFIHCNFYFYYTFMCTPNTPLTLHFSFHCKTYIYIHLCNRIRSLTWYDVRELNLFHYLTYHDTITLTFFLSLVSCLFLSL